MSEKMSLGKVHLFEFSGWKYNMFETNRIQPLVSDGW